MAHQSNHQPNGHENHLSARLRHAAFAFRGYNVTNLGRTAELLEHPAYGRIVADYLREGSQVCAETVKQPVDLLARVQERRETRDLGDYPEDVALIVAVEMAQLKLLEEFFGISMKQAKLATGYSLGEAAALIATGVYEMRHLVTVPLALARDCAALAEGVAMGVLFSRGPVLDFDTVRRMCLEISQKGKGVIDIMTYLSPNSLLLLGQEETLGRFEALMHDVFPHKVYIRRNTNRWPPLHTPLTWQKCIPNRAGVLLQTIPGGFQTPVPAVLSMVTGDTTYEEFNSREILRRWVDHPQRLWDAVYKILAGGIETVVHVGPDPNLLPATFARLSNNIRAQMNGRSLGSLGRRTLSRMVRRPWLTRLLPSFTALFRAPFVQHIILEDWLLEQKVA
jgi:[acyl-carrier-protein] S-malonyltransferase